MTFPETEPPAISEQALPWEAGIFDFGKAARPNVEYFNPSFVSRPDGDWLIARRSVWSAGRTLGQNDILAFQLDANLVPQRGFKVFIPPWHRKEHFEDPRVTVYKGRTWVGACNFVYWESGWTGAHQVLAEVDQNWAALNRFDPIYGNNGSTMYVGTGNEKNWIWFFQDDKPHLVYWADPHTVVEFDDRFGVVREYKTNTKTQWRYGEIRGGSPPVLVDDEYWTFFHSSTPWQNKRRRYHMGAYAFEAKPPFAMTRITTRPLLSGTTREYWNPNKPPVIFPCGAAMKGDEWLVTFGVNDMASGWMRIPHKALVKKTIRTGTP